MDRAVTPCSSPHGTRADVSGARGSPRPKAPSSAPEWCFRPRTTRANGAFDALAAGVLLLFAGHPVVVTVEVASVTGVAPANRSRSSGAYGVTGGEVDLPVAGRRSRAGRRVPGGDVHPDRGPDRSARVGREGLPGAARQDPRHGLPSGPVAQSPYLALTATCRATYAHRYRLFEGSQVAASPSPFCRFAPASTASRFIGSLASAARLRMSQPAAPVAQAFPSATTWSMSTRSPSPRTKPIRVPVYGSSRVPDSTTQCAGGSRQSGRGPGCRYGCRIRCGSCRAMPVRTGPGRSRSWGRGP